VVEAGKGKLEIQKEETDLTGRLWLRITVTI